MEGWRGRSSADGDEVCVGGAVRGGLAGFVGAFGVALAVGVGGFAFGHFGWFGGEWGEVVRRSGFLDIQVYLLFCGADSRLKVK